MHTEVIRAIRIVHSGKRFVPPEVSQQLSEFFPDFALTARETEVLSLIALGLGNKEAADRLAPRPERLRRTSKAFSAN